MPEANTMLWCQLYISKKIFLKRRKRKNIKSRGRAQRDKREANHHQAKRLACMPVPVLWMRNLRLENFKAMFFLVQLSGT